MILKLFPGSNSLFEHLLESLFTAEAKASEQAMEAKFANDTMVSLLCPSGKNNLYLQTQNSVLQKTIPGGPSKEGL